MPKRLFQVALFSIFFLCFTLSLSHAQDKIIAVVNNAAITQKELDDFLAFMRLQLSGEREYSARELEDKLQSLKQDLLEKLIEDKLILQEAEKNDVKVEDSLIKARMLQIKKRYRSEEEFQRSLSIQGLTEADIEERIREQAAMYSIIEQKVKSTITIGPSEITDFYSANIEEFKLPEERELNYLKVRDENIARQIENRIKKGQDLGLAANELGLAMNTLKVSSREELKPQLKGVVSQLGEHQTCEPVLIDDYYYIFNLRETTHARQQNLSEVQDSIYRFLFEKKMQEKLASWLQELKKDSYINIIGS
jgi:parvulin-like peptidyl-prolyl isomerase